MILHLSQHRRFLCLHNTQPIQPALIGGTVTLIIQTTYTRVQQSSL